MTYYRGHRSDYGIDTAKPTNRPLATKEHFELMTCPWRIGMLTGFAWFLGLAFTFVKRTYRTLRKFAQGRYRYQHRDLLWRGLGIFQSPGYQFQLKKVPRDYDALYERTSARNIFESPLRRFRKFKRLMRRPFRMAAWGFGWGFWECFFVSLRGHEDPLNGVLAGFFMQLKKGGILWRRRKGRRRIHSRSGWAGYRPLRRKFYRMPIFLSIFEMFGFIPHIYSRYVAPLPIDWEDYGSPNELEDAVGTVRRRAEKARDERTTWILPLVAAIRQRVIGLPETSVILPEERQVGKVATDQFRSKEAVAIEHNKSPNQFRLSASDLRLK